MRQTTTVPCLDAISPPQLHCPTAYFDAEASSHVKVESVLRNWTTRGGLDGAPWATINTHPPPVKSLAAGAHQTERGPETPAAKEALRGRVDPENAERVGRQHIRTGTEPAEESALAGGSAAGSHHVWHQLDYASDAIGDDELRPITMHNRVIRGGYRRVDGSHVRYFPHPPPAQPGWIILQRWEFECAVCCFGLPQYINRRQGCGERRICLEAWR